ncbi:MAG: NusG domain II-containing protein [Spirochaetales bacterium]|nr:NusG domain II-containing protein [Spirochaetales bacterium]
MNIKPGDIIIIFISLCFIIFFSAFIYNNTITNKQLSILTQEKEFIYSLQKDREIEVQGPLGVSIIHIKNGRVSMHSSPCPLKLCVAKRSISNPAEWIACLPNKVMLIIKGKRNEQTDVDSISQ